MRAIFPSGISRSPDFYNMIKIHEEVREIESDVMNARYAGEKTITINTTSFTDTTTYVPKKLDTTLLGTSNFATLSESVTTPGTKVTINNTETILKIILNGSVEINDHDTALPLSTSGNIVLGNGPTAIALVNTMTLDQIINAINGKQSQTGIFASYTNSNAKVVLTLSKDNTVDSNQIIISASSDSTVLANLGLTVGDYVIDLPSVASQIEGTVDGSGPYNLEISDANGINIFGDTFLNDMGIAATVSPSANTIKMTAHGFTNGDQVSLQSEGTLPMPLATFPTSLYYVHVVDSNTISLSTSYNNAMSGLIIDLTTTGKDFFTVKKTTDAEQYYQVFKGYSKDPIFKERMDTVIDYFGDRQYIIYRRTNPVSNTTFEWVIKW